MTDDEIKSYLDKHNYKINAQDAVMDILNSSHQIINTIYDSSTKMMTITTPNNKFTFEWVLGKYE